MAIFDIEAELAAVATALNEQGIEYAVCGGVALAVHGHPRATKDIDVVVAEASVERVRVTLRALGYTIDAAPMRFESGIEVRRVSRMESGEIFTLDLLVVTPAIEEVWRGRQIVAWKDLSLGIVSVDGLIRMKRLAGRPQDRADLATLGADDE